MGKPLQCNKRFKMTIPQHIAAGAVYDKTSQFVPSPLESSPGLTLSFQLTERHIYGSSRFGIETEQLEMIAPIIPSTTNIVHRILGQKQYELSNHLGNVLSVINDIKLPITQTTGTGENEVTTIVSYSAVVVSATDYSPFGVALYGRSWSGGGYRYGFNRKEKDSDMTADNYDFGARIYDGRLWRWLSVDPCFRRQPEWSTYKGFKNNSIIFCDPDGNTEYLTIIIQDNHGNKISFTVEQSEDVMTDGKKVTTTSYLLGQPWGTNYDTRYYDFETTKTYTIDDNGKLQSASEQTKILYENGIKDEDTVLTVGETDKDGDTKDPDGFNDTDFQESGIHLTSAEGGSSPVNNKSNGGESRDIGDFLSAVGKFTKDPASLPDITSALGPAKFSKLVAELKKVVEKQSSTESAPAKGSQPQAGDSVYIEYILTTKHPAGRSDMPEHESQSSAGGKGVIPKDTIEGKFKGNPNTKVRDVKKL